MPANKFKLAKSLSPRLPQLKSRTGLTPNVLCRLGFCLSLSDPATPDPAQYTEDGFEFNRYTLLGDYEPLLMGLLRERLLKENLDAHASADAYFRAHMNRGVEMLARRVRSLTSVLEMLPQDNRSKSKAT